jgi:hypothetical protein
MNVKVVCLVCRIQIKNVLIEKLPDIKDKVAQRMEKVLSQALG